MIWLVAALMLATDGGGATGALSPSEVYARISSTVFVVESEAGQGSAVVVGPELLVTNQHVIDKASRISVRQYGRTWLATVEKFNVDHDLALLRVTGLRRPVPRRVSLNSLKVGYRIFALGAPVGLEQTFSEGLISALRPEPKPGTFPVQFSAPINHGSSGGGIFDERGRLVGVPTSHRHSKELVGDLNFAVPMDWVEELIASPRLSGSPSAVVSSTPDPDPEFDVRSRPKSLECRVDRQLRFVPRPNGQLDQFMGTESISRWLYATNFDQEVVEVADGDLFSGEHWLATLAQADVEEGVVDFAGAGHPPVRFYFQKGIIVSSVEQYVRLGGQQRRIAQIGYCFPFDYAQRRIEHNAVEAATALSRAKAQDARHDEKGAALSYRQACLFDDRAACETALKRFETLKDYQGIRDVQVKQCELAGFKECPKTRRPLRKRDDEDP